MTVPGDGQPAATPIEQASAPTTPVLIETTDERIARLSRELAEAVRERGGASFPGIAGATLAHAVEPTGREPSTLGLTSAEQRSIGALKLVAEGFMRGRAASGSPSDAAAVLALALTALETDNRVGITEATLASRVLGFGQWTPLGSSSFVAGRAVPMIVYAELDGFATREASVRESERMGIAHTDENRAAELEVTLALYHAADGVLAWRRPTERVIDVSRRDRRDFYVIAEVELPPSLSVGSYALKVRVRDQVGGTEDERNIPITIVGDRSALTTAPAD